ncbi:scavenger receptor cysteine-rich domain superfamily protein [Lingula anatina]|uniref:Scavenger receptor cysteine-rich domain superfamily protein n=1 Tax=Lingula anatina TaxID=7574 RepID=A0A2R2MLM0_LINAN|nr:scavenger receptor cysteine-rich domain superfamily protein [Lingula anatina]|eukprot:XP_023931116.1 scavenger receptor cysteine-rich domain superfamily protein [Lingula anatina]
MYQMTSKGTMILGGSLLLTLIAVGSGQPATEVRLVGGAHIMEGRGEVFHNGEWGTVCDDDWDLEEAGVVCRMLGYNSDYATPYLDAYSGEGTGSILMGNVTCYGWETSIKDCIHDGWQSHYCDHSENAGVSCFNPGLIMLDGVRLVGGSHPGEGRIEVLQHRPWGTEWGTVCNDDWDDIDAAVVCRMLGYGDDGAIAFSSATFGRGNGSLIENVDCIGSEGSLEECFYTWGTYNCTSTEDAGVRCLAGEPTTPSIPTTASVPIEVRLVGSARVKEGRVEVFHNGEWGTVCDDSWDNNDARVVCRMLDGVRLVGGTHPGEGRVEVLLHSPWVTEWVTVCDDDWDDIGAAVVCRMLGYG